MKTTTSLLTMVLALTAAAAWAQDTGTQPLPPPGAPPPLEGGPQGGPGGGPRRPPPPMPLMIALDVNHDGIIDAQEIANAATALKTLDANGDGKLTREEYLPPRPPGMGPQGRNGARRTGLPPPPRDDDDAPPPPPPTGGEE